MKSSSRGQSNIVAEALLISIAMILATAFVLSLNSNVSYYLERRELVSVYISTTNKGNWVNFTTVHSGGDLIIVSGQIYITFKNSTSMPLSAILIYKGSNSLIDGKFQLDSFEFGETFKVCVNTIELNDCTVHLILSSRSQILAEVSKRI